MPIDPVIVPQYPNVPNSPGVPAVLRDPSALPSIPGALLNSDGAGVAAATRRQPWGLFTTGMKQVVTPDNVALVGLKANSTIAKYPIENGAFGSYNKVQMPYDAEIVFTKGGSNNDRATFLKAIEAAKQSLDLYSISMPEITYPNANVVDYDFRRTSDNGVTLIRVSVYLEEVRTAPDAQFTQTATGDTSGTPSAVLNSLTPQKPANYGPVASGTAQLTSKPPQIDTIPKYSNSGFGGAAANYGPPSGYSNSPFQ